MFMDINNIQEKKSRDLLKPRYVMLPVGIGLAVVLYMFYSDFESLDFSSVELSLSSIPYFLLAWLFIAGRDFGLTW